jgi:hypothetical protein
MARQGKTELLQAHAQPQSAATTQVTPATRKAKRYLTRKLQREAIERSNWAVWPIDQDWVKNISHSPLFLIYPRSLGAAPSQIGSGRITKA